MMMFFAVWKIFSFMRSHLLIVDLSACAISVLFGKSFPVPVSSRLFLTFSSDSGHRFHDDIFGLLELSFGQGSK